MIATGDLQNPHLDGSPLWHPDGQLGVLLLHGLLATPAGLRPLAERLVADGCAVHVPLLPGHGTTISDLHRRRWQEWFGAAQSALRRLQSLNLPCVVVGSSMGALLALALAADASAVSAVVGAAPCVRFRNRLSELAHLLRYAVQRREKQRVDPTSIVETRWQGYQADSLPALAELLKLRDYTMERLRNIRQPTLLLQGRRDETVDPRGCIDLFSHLGSQSKSLVWLGASSHCVLLDHEQDRAIDEIVSFIRPFARPAGPPHDLDGR